jgi:AraC family transcriptional regulator, positive regulator of tynA and feaB
MPHWTTAQLPEPRRFEYWREVICQSFVSLRPERLHGSYRAGTAQPFDCTLSAWESRGLLFGRVSGTGQQVHRDAAGIQTSDRPVYFLNIQKSGHGEIEQGGVRAVLDQHSFAIVDATQPFRMLLSDDFEHLSIKIPKEMLCPSLSNAHNATARKVDAKRGVGRLAVNALETLADEINLLDSTSAKFAIDQALALTACALNAASGHSSVPNAQPQNKLVTLRSQAIALIARSLDDPDLDVHHIAQSLGVSVRYVQLAFAAAQTSVGKWVLEQRLQRCKDDLLNTHLSPMAVGNIALKHGFSDLSHFSRAFKLRYGQAPGQLRQAGNPLVKPSSPH